MCSVDSKPARVGKTTDKRPPFQLCFPRDTVLGKSDIGRTKANGDSVAYKFYAKEYGEASNAREETAEYAKNELRRDAQRLLLTSQMYGWWYRLGMESMASQIDFRKRTTNLVNFGTKMHAERKKLGH